MIKSLLEVDRVVGHAARGFQQIGGGIPGKLDHLAFNFLEAPQAADNAVLNGQPGRAEHTGYSGFGWLIRGHSFFLLWRLRRRHIFFIRHSQSGNTAAPRVLQQRIF